MSFILGAVRASLPGHPMSASKLRQPHKNAEFAKNTVSIIICFIPCKSIIFADILRRKLLERPAIRAGDEKKS